MDERLSPGPKKKMRNMTFRKISHKKLIERKEWLDDYSLSYPESNDEYFAGFSIIVAGDFYQLPPVSGTAIFEPRAKTTIGMAAPVTFYARETRTDYFEEQAVYLFATRASVFDMNYSRLREANVPVLPLRARHSDPRHASISSKEFNDLAAELPLTIGARVMLTANMVS
ncbi:hypothetical protein E4U45_002359 [Claviceps purpurea]|nr:hypothetical protein E4U45_002359 [Claviceps purpurea]